MVVLKRALLLAPLLALVAAPALALPATPADCADPCVISAHFTGYVAPVAHLESGTTVRWESLDTTHVNADGTGVGDDPNCFVVSSGAVTPSEDVRFDIVDGALFATVGDATSGCANAQALPDGSFVQPYYCILHPNMRGALVVSPAA